MKNEHNETKKTIKLSNDYGLFRFTLKKNTQTQLEF